MLVLADESDSVRRPCEIFVIVMGEGARPSGRFATGFAYVSRLGQHSDKLTIVSI